MGRPRKTLPSPVAASDGLAAAPVASTALVPVPPAPLEGEVLPPLPTQIFPAGYAPEKLDDLITPTMTAATTALTSLNRVLPLLSTTADKLENLQLLSATGTPDEFKTAEQLANISDKTARVIGNLTKAVDSLSRLRSLLSGGPDQRVEKVSSLSDRELMVMVMAAAGRCPKCGHNLSQGG